MGYSLHASLGILSSGAGDETYSESYAAPVRPTYMRNAVSSATRRDGSYRIASARRNTRRAPGTDEIACLYASYVILENVCLRPWAFERIPNKMIRGLDNALIYTSTKEACLAACLNEHRFTCRSVEYNYVTLQCHLGDSDRRTTGQYVQFVDAQGVDYFENLCLKGKQEERIGFETEEEIMSDKIAGIFTEKPILP